ncbi:MAG TPA: YbhB/YbcL family Raf kinase inhibitor-like protein [Candidatus Babeliaceae bacterium]|nr:YbhB/YbcL family Raf kinase inhibitor-like protein [Candidatus Babeliaceae bacterium]
MPLTAKFSLHSPAFAQSGYIPRIYTCDHNHQDVSPELEWQDIPNGTQSLALIVDDPDAPNGVYTHWIIFNIPANSNHIARGVPATATLTDGSRQGTNSANKIGYTSPCPPTGTHHYHFKLYALDTLLDLEPGITKQQLETALQGHIIDNAELIGLYRRA